jgi:hypothetical protein
MPEERRTAIAKNMQKDRSWHVTLSPKAAIIQKNNQHVKSSSSLERMRLASMSSDFLFY